MSTFRSIPLDIIGKTVRYAEQLLPCVWSSPADFQRRAALPSHSSMSAPRKTASAHLLPSLVIHAQAIRGSTPRGFRIRIIMANILIALSLYVKKMSSRPYSMPISAVRLPHCYEPTPANLPSPFFFPSEAMCTFHLELLAYFGRAASPGRCYVSPFSISLSAVFCLFFFSLSLLFSFPSTSSRATISSIIILYHFLEPPLQLHYFFPHLL